MKSVWNKIEKPSFPSLDGDEKTDVLVIGGGMCGVMCAYMLKNAGVDCLLVEADTICSGITNGTTAKITVQHGLVYSKIAKKYGVEKALLYYESQSKALDILTKLARKTDADLEYCNSFVYSLNNRAAIEEEVYALDNIGVGAKFCHNTELPFKVSGAVKIYNQAMFHPLKFAFSISAGLKIYENTKVIGLKNNIAVTNNGKIMADKIIVATHFPIINKHGGYCLKMYQHRSYVLALENAQNVKGMYVDEANHGLSFRRCGNLLLLGGGGHRTGGKGGNWSELEKIYKKYYSSSREVTRWATQDCITLDGIPYIGRYSKFSSDLYVATGFNKWGMTSSVVSAMILKNMICGEKSEYEEVYSPSRTVMHPQLAFNMLESVKGLVTLRTPRCPHMGCVLKYNKAEHSWDCPCHGSRFEENGKLINNPATDDKSF